MLYSMILTSSVAVSLVRLILLTFQMSIQAKVILKRNLKGEKVK